MLCCIKHMEEDRPLLVNTTYYGMLLLLLFFKYTPIWELHQVASSKKRKVFVN